MLRPSDGEATGKPWWDRRLDDLPDDFFDTLPHMTEAQRAEAKRLFKEKLALSRLGGV